MLLFMLCFSAFYFVYSWCWYSIKFHILSLPLSPACSHILTHTHTYSHTHMRYAPLPWTEMAIPAPVKHTHTQNLQVKQPVITFSLKKNCHPHEPNQIFPMPVSSGPREMALQGWDTVVGRDSVEPAFELGQQVKQNTPIPPTHLVS